ncbi:hypothetical protein NQ318_004000 [Aromia moschata]|uniref:Uncharacterized protein n=1 Tax=Aromia moschata TaxID=1265417 RepID=A0AAV8ZAC7_9CUCU|nr:hypothetical protein NQ318_004000 [Aromia moschata]
MFHSLCPELLFYWYVDWKKLTSSAQRRVTSVLSCYCYYSRVVTNVPAVAFGLIYGNFLASVGDETTGTALTNGVFNTVQSFTGLAAFYLLQRYPYRNVGLIGATLTFIGSIASIFVTNLAHVIISYGILQGLGYGLMMPSSYSALNSYFDKKRTLMMNIAQSVASLGAMVFPPLIALLMPHFGFRAALAVLAATSLLHFPAMGVLQPVEMHMRKIPVDAQQNNALIHTNLDKKAKSLTEDVLRDQIEPLLNKSRKENALQDIQSLHTINLNTKSGGLEKEKLALKHLSRVSIVDLGTKTASLITINYTGARDQEEKPNLMDLSLLKDPKYLNISFGISLSYTADVAFFSIIPLILNNIGFATADIAFLMMVYFGADLVSRTLISVVSGFYVMKNRHVFLTGTFLSAVLRTAFVLNDTYIWKMVTLSALGFLRGLIQTPLPLVIAEEYTDTFPTAFSLFMVICGFISLIFGPLMSYAKSVTQSDVIVIHLLTVAFLTCSVSWMVELLWVKLNGKKTSG